MLKTADSVLAFERTRLDGSGRVLCVHSLVAETQRITIDAEVPEGAEILDLCEGSSWTPDAPGGLAVEMPPYGVRWLLAEPLK